MSLIDGEAFLRAVSGANDWIIGNFSGLFSLTAFGALPASFAEA